MKLNGFAPFAEAVRDEVNGIRTDWRVTAAELRAEVSRSLLELERVGMLARERLAALRDGLDGAPGRDGTSGVDGKDGAPGRDGLDGKDGAPGRDGVDGKHGVDGKDGEPGRDGDPGQPGERGAKGEQGDRGLPGDRGDKGDRGEQGARGERGEVGPAGVFKAPKKYAAGVIFYRGELAYHEGSTFVALADTVATPPHADWQPVAWRGAAGYCGEARGLHDPTATYRAMDVVTSNGSEWRAVRDDPGPLPGDGWVMGAKGAKGKPGDKGEPGERGRPGADAPRIDQVICGKDFSLVLMMTDGSAIACDLSPILERYRDFVT